MYVSLSAQEEDTQQTHNVLLTFPYSYHLVIFWEANESVTKISILEPKIVSWVKQGESIMNDSELLMAYTIKIM